MGPRLAEYARLYDNGNVLIAVHDPTDPRIDVFQGLRDKSLRLRRREANAAATCSVRRRRRIRCE